MLLWRQVTSQTAAHIDTTSVYSEGRLTIHILPREYREVVVGAIMKLHGHDNTLVLCSIRVATAAPYVK